MAIKVKHEGNVASRVASSAAGGAAKRAMEAAAFAKGRDIQQKQAASAHASAPHASAQLISAPTGAGAVGGAAHAGLIGGGGGIGAQGGSRIRTPFDRAQGASGGGTAYSRGSGASAPDTPKKVTGSDEFRRPDDASVWNPIKERWEREYLPGEYEAEAKDRIDAVDYGWKRYAADDASARRIKEANAGQALRNAEYTFKQKADWANLEQAYQDAAASGRYTPQELEVLRKQVDLQKANIKGNPFEALEPKQTAQQDIDSRLVTVNGQQMYRNSKGDLELVPTTPQSDNDFSDFVKMYPKMTKTVMQEQIDANGRVVNVPVQVQMTPEEAIRAWNKMKAEWGNTGTQEGEAQKQEEKPISDYSDDYWGIKRIAAGIPIYNDSPQDAAKEAVATGGDPVVAARQAAEKAQVPVATTNTAPQVQASVPAAVDNGAGTNAAPVQADAQQVNAETNAPSATTPEDRWAKYERTNG